MIVKFLDWRLRKYRDQSRLPDLPEVRRMMRLAWWSGFTFGLFRYDEEAARKEAIDAIYGDLIKQLRDKIRVISQS